MSDSSESAKLKIIVSGIFEFNLGFDDEQKESIITKNTMAILFPYLRAQITIMTSQPDVEPVVLPAININALLKNMEINKITFYRGVTITVTPILLSLALPFISTILATKLTLCGFTK